MNPAGKWLPNMDSNHDRLLQRQPCYRYTIRHSRGEQSRGFRPRVKRSARDGQGLVCHRNTASF